VWWYGTQSCGSHLETMMKANMLRMAGCEHRKSESCMISLGCFPALGKARLWTCLHFSITLQFLFFVWK
jgi:hypothetical protein